MSLTDKNLTLIREWVDTDEPEPEDGWEWPAPSEWAEYRVEGQMRADVLARLGRPADDSCQVRLISGWVEGGYSEFTVEHDYPIEVWVDDDRQSQKVYSDDDAWDEGRALAGFLRWLTEESDR